MKWDSDGICGECGDEIIQEIDHTKARSCFGSDELANYRGLCILCHKDKTYMDTQRMSVEDSNPYMSRFSSETWLGFVESRRPTQVVCNLHKPNPDQPCLNIDVKSCRQNALMEANVHPIPVFSPIYQFTTHIN